MNSFQILNAEGQAIAINTLDKEAALFWGKEVDVKQYANPSAPRMEGESEATFYRRSTTSNWFDAIGWRIANQGNYTSGWRNVVHTMISEIMGSNFIDGDKDAPIPTLKLRKCIEVKEDGTQVNAWHLEDELENSIAGTMLYFEPYIDLINHWKSKGYQPKKIENE